MREYDRATAIANHPLIHPCTWETDSSIFLAMSQLNFLSRTWASFPSIPSMARTNVDFPRFLYCLNNLLKARIFVDFRTHRLWYCIPLMLKSAMNTCNPEERNPKMTAPVQKSGERGPFRKFLVKVSKNSVLDSFSTS